MAHPDGNKRRIEIIAADRLGATVNGQLFERSIRHAHWIEQLKTGEANAVASFLNAEFIPDLEGELRRRLVSIEASGGALSTQRLVDLRVWSRGFVSVATREIYKNQKGSFHAIAKAEARMEVEGVNRILPRQLKGPRFELSFVAPAPGSLSPIVTHRPLEGRVLRDWWSGLARSTSDTIDAQIKVGLISGETTDQIAARIFGRATEAFEGSTMAAMRRHSRTITRTAVTGITSRAREVTYEANTDIVKGVMIVATLDARTTDICMGLDGKVFRVGEGPRPEFHHQCRTTTSPVLKGTDELGLTDGAVDLSSATRSSMFGEVPGKLRYPQFLKRQTLDFQNEALGKGRAQLWRRGKVPIERFTKRDGIPLSLRDLEKIERRIESGALNALPPRLPGQVLQETRGGAGR